jgi:PAS domain S-box-containing protein
VANDPQIHQLQLLHRASLAFSASLDLDEIFHAILDEVCHIHNAVGWAVWKVSDENQDFVCHQAAGAGSDKVIGYRISMDTPFIATVISTGTSLYIPDTSLDRKFDDQIAVKCGVEVRSMIVAPLSSQDVDEALTTVGLIIVIADTTHAFTPDDRTLIDTLAASASAAIHNGRLYQRARDEIEDRRRAEAALRESESHYRTLIETSPDAVISVSLGGHLQMCNQRALELFGYNHPTEILGRSYLTLFPPEARVRAIRGFNSVAQGTALRNEETSLLRADGTLFQGEIAAALAANNVGEPTNIIGFARDVTDRKEAEMAMRRHNEELRVLNSIATQITQAHNLEQLLGISLDKTLNALEVDTGWITLFATDKCPKTAADIELQITRGLLSALGIEDRGRSLRERIEERVCLTRKIVAQKTTDLLELYAGMTAPCPVIGSPLTVDDAVVGVLGVVGLSNRHPRSIHARQEQLLSAISYQISVVIENARLAAEAAEVKMLRELEQMRSELIANFSHDLRSPLGLIEMATSTLLRDDLDITPELQHELLDDVIAQTKRLSHLVEGILDLGRLESGRLKLRAGVVDIGELLRQIGKEIDDRYPRHSLQLTLPESPLLASADAQKLQQVLYNLLDNAAKYSPDGGAIHTSGSQCNGNIIVRVEDSGVGIPKDQLQLIFERFYRVNDKSTEGISGVGLGLSMCKGIIEAHGGHIWVNSAYGQGSTFAFTLPAAPDLTTEREVMQ